MRDQPYYRQYVVAISRLISSGLLLDIRLCSSATMVRDEASCRMCGERLSAHQRSGWAIASPRHGHVLGAVAFCRPCSLIAIKVHCLDLSNLDCWVSDTLQTLRQLGIVSVTEA